jgi:hypothetical protein
MDRRAAFRIIGALISLACATVGSAAPLGIVPPPEGPPSAPRAHGFMLYLSQPLGGSGGTLRPKFGLRLEQVRMVGNTAAPESGDPLQHRALIGWQVEGRRDMRLSDIRVDLGNRMTYDVTRGAFGPQVSKSVMALAVQPRWVAQATLQSPDFAALAAGRKFAAEPDVVARAIAQTAGKSKSPQCDCHETTRYAGRGW